MIHEYKIEEYVNAISSPGKFESETVLTPYFYDLMIEGDGENLATGMDGESATYFDISHDSDAKKLVGTKALPSRDAQSETVNNYYCHVLLIENSDGFCTLVSFHSESDARESGEFYFGPNIEDDDITVSDLDEIPAVVKRMNREEFWPNIWHVNERGNTDLLSVNSDTGEHQIIKSWV